MKDIVQFCDKTINKTAKDIKNTESSLKKHKPKPVPCHPNRNKRK